MRSPTTFLACYLVLIKDNKICLLKRKNTGFQDGNYSMIAGHLEQYETLKASMAREAKEEADLSIDLNKMELVHIMHRKSAVGDREYIDFFIKVDDLDQEPKNLEPDKCSEIVWFDMEKLPENIIPYIKTAIEIIKKKEMFSEYGF